MPKPYDLTNVTNSQNMFQSAKATNELVNGGLAIGLLVGAFIVLFAAFMRYGAAKAFAGASWIVAVFAIFLRLLGFISNEVMYMTFLIAALGLIWVRFEGGG